MAGLGATNSAALEETQITRVDPAEERLTALTKQAQVSDQKEMPMVVGAELKLVALSCLGSLMRNHDSCVQPEYVEN